MRIRNLEGGQNTRTAGRMPELKYRLAPLPNSCPALSKAILAAFNVPYNRNDRCDDRKLPCRPFLIL
jgi:hypothetical protein